MANIVERLNAALVDRYRIERELGAGGMATVYLAEDLKHDRKVAVKLLKPELTAVLGGGRFIQEIKTTAALSHPHILPLFDSGEADGFLYYVMPYLEGETIREKLNREKQLGIEEAVKIATEVADALDYAHRHGIIHRDIKPENILLHDGRPMVMDFGIALAVSAAAGGRMTETGLSLGTPHYMSPEQATADREITARSDIYSLASVLYELLAGVPPHEGGTAQQTIMRIITETPRRVSELRRSVPRNVAAAVMKALEKLPADRFPSARAFADALGDPTFGADAGLVDGNGAAVGPRRAIGLRTVAAAAMAALLTGILGTTLLWRPGVEPARTARLMLQFPAGEMPLNAGIFSIPVLAQAPDGSGMYYWGAASETGTQLMLRSWDRLSADRLSQRNLVACCITVSQSGDSIAWETDRALFVAPINGIPRAVADSGLSVMTEAGGGVDWGDDGWLYVSGTGGLLRVSPRGNQAELVAGLDAVRGDARYLWPSVLPGSRAVLVTIQATGQSDAALAMIGVADLATGRVEPLLQGVRAIYAPTGHLIVARADGGLWAAPFDIADLSVTGRERALPDSTSPISGVSNAVDLSLSPSGTLVYTTRRAGSVHAAWVDRSGAEQPVAVDLAGPAVFDPVLSRDGRLAITMVGEDGSTNIWVRRPEGGPLSRITFDRPTSMRAAWRPGTEAISFVTLETGSESLEAYEWNGDGSGGTRKLDVGDPRGIGGTAWSPDGTWFVLRTDNLQDGNGDIFAIRPGVDTIARPLIATPAQELAPAVSPDGNWIAYSSDILGRHEIFVSPFPDTRNTQIQVSPAGGITPVWSRDGRELFYVDYVANMISVPVPVDPGPTFRHGEPAVLFSAASFVNSPFYPQYAVASDGERFVMLKAEIDPNVNVVVVFNFLDELKRMMDTQ